MKTSPLISAAELADQVGGPRPPALLDVRWSLSGPSGIEPYRAGHLPGAVFVDLDTELAGPIGASTGRHPLPAIADLQAAARRWGLRTGQPVVTYDDTHGAGAARAWWLLRWAGLDDVRVLDGGLAAWVNAGGALTTGDSDPSPGDVELDAGHLPTLDADQAARLANRAVLLDARSAERFRGEVEPIDPIAGRIPGAVSAPTTDNLDGDGRLLDEDALRRRFAELGVDPDSEVGVYCGSGVTAAHEILALATIGVDAALYPGSWSEWITDPSRPVATGEPSP
jgi:thiosulfate/3-mercaptopyruvate sulfurtransferase